MSYGALFTGGAAPAPVTDATIGEFLRCSLGLSAWKEYQASRWALRVNPSSGNLHPTEAYVVTANRVCHYAPREHALEVRCDKWGRRSFVEDTPGTFLVGLTSILWREAWKYGERAFRYCQHDVGHAIGALRFAAALLGWRMTLLTRWSDADIAALLGLDRDDDYRDAEREEAECLAIVTAGDPNAWRDRDPAPLVDAARGAAWHGAANRLSASHVEWPIIDEIATATRYPGGGAIAVPDAEGSMPDAQWQSESHNALSIEPSALGSDARSAILQRRSAVAFDARSSLPRETFLSMLQRLDPGAPPFDAIDWPPQVHLALFVHRVEGLTPGLYAYLRDPAAVGEWRAAMRDEFLWETVSNAPNVPNDPNGLFLLLPTDVQWAGMRVSCDQDIAGQGFFSLGMIARFEAPLRERGDWFYRRLFWECGLIGQVLYLEAEAAGARSTGIGCFYDDAVHELLGLSGHAWQSLYHFSMGVPVDDARLTTEPGYVGGW